VRSDGTVAVNGALQVDASAIINGTLQVDLTAVFHGAMQVDEPALFNEQVNCIYGLGVGEFLEAGPFQLNLTVRS